MNAPLNIRDFMDLANRFPVIDVRSPGEFKAGHMPFASNIPLFTDEERAKVGTIYKEVGREKAIEVGYEIVNPKRSRILSTVKKLIELTPNTGDKTPGTVLVHCWRGGMRSERFASFLNDNGFRTHTLIKGYKSYRQFVINSFETKRNIILLGGETGSGKTEILKKIKNKGENVIDLEGIANHKGSAFGSLGENPQPTQEQFENNLSQEFSRIGPEEKMIWLEDEARTIGFCHLPNPLWESMKSAPIIRVNIPKKERIERLVLDYGNYSKEALSSCILKIQKRLGPQHAKQALEELETGNLGSVADITLTYYDKAYNYNHEMRAFKDVHVLECQNSNVDLNAEKVLDFAKQINLNVDV